MDTPTLRIKNVGQIADARVAFGDLTVLVGPQATGKSIFLQFFKLLVDTGRVLAHLKQYGLDWKKDSTRFLDIYLGEGMGAIWRKGQSRIFHNGSAVDVQKLVSRQRRNKDESMFYIPAQRVLALRDGWPRPFSDYKAGDPFAVRDFSENLRLLIEPGLGDDRSLFPQTRRLKSELRNLLNETVFRDFELRVDEDRPQRRLVLAPSSRGRPRKPRGSLPFMVWSVGQREFVPLLLGFYWLLPPTKVSRRGNIEWVVIEEVEMGLHPTAISAVLLLVLELLSRGYRVCISTHSPHVLDMVWALKIIQHHGAGPEKLLELFDVRATPNVKSMAQRVLGKDARVYYFDQRTQQARDISSLDPGASEPIESGWGGLTEFSGRTADVVAGVVGGSRE